MTTACATVAFAPPPAAPAAAAPAAAAPAAAAPAAAPLSAQHLRELAEARQRGTRIRRCVAVATFDGWSVGVFGALTLLCGMFSVVGWVLGGGMIAIAYVELSTVPRLKQFQPRAARRLGWNQVALASLLLGYAGWSLHQALLGPDPLASTIAAAPETAAMLAPYSAVARTVSAAVYVGLALVAIVAQGGAALYYFTREKHVRAYRDQTPAWITSFQSAGGSL